MTHNLTIPGQKRDANDMIKRGRRSLISVIFTLSLLIHHIITHCFIRQLKYN